MERRLTVTRCCGGQDQGTIADGGGLFLQVVIGANGTPRKSWFIDLKQPVTDKLRLMGLGSLADVSTLSKRVLSPATRRV